MKVKRRWSSNGTAAFGEGERRLMISSSEVGGCCRVQVARLFPSIALSSFSSRSSSSFSFSRFLLPPFRASPLAQGFPPSRSLSLYRSHQPSSCSLGHSTSKNSNPTTITEATHARRSLQGCSPFHPRLLPGTCRLFMGPRSINAVPKVSISVGILSRFFFEYSSGENIYSAPAGFLCDTF